MVTKTQGELVAGRDEARFLAAFAHEINNSAQVLLELLSLAEAEIGSTHPARSYLQTASDEAHRDSQLAHAAVDSHSYTCSAGDFDVSGMLHSVVDSYQSRFMSRGITVAERYRRVLSCSGHRESLRQAFSTLLLNAADAVERGGKLHVRVCEVHELSGQHRHGAQITIGDNGTGIPAEDLPHIWEAFFSTKGSGGMGLGLFLVRNAIEVDHGVVRVRSSTKAGRKGTVFTTFLPYGAMTTTRVPVIGESERIVRRHR